MGQSGVREYLVQCFWLRACLRRTGPALVCFDRLEYGEPQPPPADGLNSGRATITADLTCLLCSSKTNSAKQSSNVIVYQLSAALLETPAA